MTEEFKKEEKKKKQDQENLDEDILISPPKKETTETIEEEMEHGEKDEDVYTKEGREKLEEDDELEPWEEAFMEGAEGDGQDAKDALTGEPIMDIEHAYEAEIDGKVYRFVAEEHIEKFKEKKAKEDES